MSCPAYEIQGAIDSLNELTMLNIATFSTAGVTPANIKSVLTAQGEIVAQKDTAQERKR